MIVRTVTRFMLACLVAVSPLLAQAQDVEIWLDSGDIEIGLENGETVQLRQGEYLSCEQSVCEILPLASAPPRPEFLQFAAASPGAGGGAAPVAGGVAPFALGAEAGVLAGAAVAGAAVIAAGVIIGIAASGDSTPSTTNGQ